MSSIYFIGIGGSAMASVAVALSHMGHAVTGSDTQLYPPMSTYLENHNIRYFNSFSAENLKSATPDLVVVGNAISRGNPDLEYALDQHMELISMPQLVRRELIGRHTSIVVAGTHGKTTTTSLVAWLLEAGGLLPGFLIGGIPENFGDGCRPSGLSEPGFFVTEGDEYDSAFFDKRSKFLHYRPDIAIINNVEFDHADIFDSLDDIKKSFRLLVNLVPSNGLLIVNADDPNSMEVSAKAFCRVETFGLNGNAEWTAADIATDTDGTSFTVVRDSEAIGRVKVPLFGNYNVMNALAATAAAIRAGVSFESVTRGLCSFKRPKRRMELVGEYAGGITLIEDFAHHPTAIRLTLGAIAEHYPGRRIIACFEPRSNTTSRNIFQHELSECFGDAAIVVLGKVNRPERYAPEERLDAALLCRELKANGKRVFAAGSENYPEDIVRFIEAEQQPGDVVVLLSNGSFSGLKEMLAESFQKNS
ncbi:MAG TPA: UDP-N-acetylmuramate:L-alanyl-gamma-D-glutamyl-meso-diaminopimelate ligase [Chlorobaculum sp.]|uniref:UDP-N-acetylmuramate:L-alanyl-gamma-D-glutamyl-meso-diaminopimelate ligase n=1 Tax=Chlorobaculum tepidum (strain ATCC 49652 / DSM 12025 / NBRC 103806 / TLS) TaxID=194439 RepID=Q8KCE3_CHLTE|nr:UDP-N-acetylmuramate:L-alanyl-gamma-D-glutamyl-meso-diaminopimelate ligase [Chlorobaculum tepidum]AAM72706.1 UDP-N-acetylmuramate:L-alanyl-gamma-D-glutamyl-meso-diaminopimelate ligase [Chlorobaculum tepidum TLS]HBU22631.1 UDP-N-acetylmuramate:L-alanyl-gamma-D-glutamyl-meso-diaminopimelate ligase [Chlorobaculum sp.]